MVAKRSGKLGPGLRVDDGGAGCRGDGWRGCGVSAPLGLPQKSVGPSGPPTKAPPFPGLPEKTLVVPFPPQKASALPGLPQKARAFPDRSKKASVADRPSTVENRVSCKCGAAETRSPPCGGLRVRVRGGRSAQSMSRKLRSCSLRLGWRSLRRALASIWRMRSRVTSNCLPTSSSV